MTQQPSVCVGCKHAQWHAFIDQSDEDGYCSAPVPWEKLRLPASVGKRDICREVGRRGPTYCPVREDATCEHGTAWDVHCCGCHSGFIFDLSHACPVREDEKAKSV